MAVSLSPSDEANDAATWAGRWPSDLSFPIFEEGRGSGQRSPFVTCCFGAQAYRALRAIVRIWRTYAVDLGASGPVYRARIGDLDGRWFRD
jgi:hypothetical protein